MLPQSTQLCTDSGKTGMPWCTLSMGETRGLRYLGSKETVITHAPASAFTSNPRNPEADN
jgi:hypothetical protein